jgi:hypothetical protein
MWYIPRNSKENDYKFIPALCQVFVSASIWKSSVIFLFENCLGNSVTHRELLECTLSASGCVPAGNWVWKGFSSGSPSVATAYTKSTYSKLTQGRHNYYHLFANNQIRSYCLHTEFGNRVGVTYLYFHNMTAPSAQWPPHYRGFPITLGHTTLGRTSLDEWSVRGRDLYLTTHNAHKRQTSMTLARFESAIPASKLL